mmetsp:Transcript_66720/g.146275  ORF Transcript_66720/g.146275 Transcript_66720/m.146275 type:complete len:206 (+) Transcript_66720:436-1053(+)
MSPATNRLHNVGDEPISFPNLSLEPKKIQLFHFPPTKPRHPGFPKLAPAPPRILVVCLIAGMLVAKALLQSVELCSRLALRYPAQNLKFCRRRCLGRLLQKASDVLQNRDPRGISANPPRRFNEWQRFRCNFGVGRNEKILNIPVHVSIGTLLRKELAHETGNIDVDGVLGQILHWRATLVMYSTSSTSPSRNDVEIEVLHVVVL